MTKPIRHHPTKKYEWKPDKKSPLTLAEYKAKGQMTPFMFHLLSMDERLRFPELGDGIIEGQSYIPTKNYLYIPYAVPNMVHQISHMVEMTKLERCIQPDWGMVPNSLDGQTAGLFAALIREARVRSIQSYLAPWIIEYEDEESDYGGLLNLNMYINNATSRIKKKPFGRFYFRKDIIEYIEMTRDKTIQAWSLDRIEAEWKKRLQYIQHWMETQEK